MQNEGVVNLDVSTETPPLFVAESLQNSSSFEPFEKTQIKAVELFLTPVKAC